MIGGRVCLNCKQAPARTKWCSVACEREAKLDRSSAATQARRQTPKTCLDCRAAYLVTTRKGPHTKRCPECRLAARKATKHKHNQLQSQREREARAAARLNGSTLPGQE